MPLLVNVSLIVNIPVFVYVVFNAVVNTFCSTAFELVTFCRIFVLPLPLIALASSPAFKFKIPLLSIAVVDTTLSALVVKLAPSSIVTLFCVIVLSLLFVTVPLIFVVPVVVVVVILLARLPPDKFNTPRLSAPSVICKFDAEISAVPLLINDFWLKVLPKVVLPLSIVVAPFEPDTDAIVLVPVKFNALVFVMPFVNLLFSTFKVPELVTAAPSNP